MDDLISRSELLKSYDIAKMVEYDETGCGVDRIAIPVDTIKKAPAIDAETVRHGRWEWYEDWGPSTWLEPPDLINAGWKCSTCGIDLGDYLTDCLGVNVYVDEEDKIPKIKSCPHCGTKMDAKEG